MRMVCRTSAILGLLLFLPAAAHAQQSPDLPDDVDRFYQARNTIATISTPMERAALATNTTDIPLTERLARARSLLRSIAAHELPIDPGMIVQTNGAFPFIPSAILEIVAVRKKSEDELEVEATAYHLDHEYVLLYIQAYESGKKLEAPHQFSLSPVTSREVHTWRRIGGRWLRESAGMTLLAD